MPELLQSWLHFISVHSVSYLSHSLAKPQGSFLIIFLIIETNDLAVITQRKAFLRSQIEDPFNFPSFLPARLYLWIVLCYCSHSVVAIHIMLFFFFFFFREGKGGR